MEPELRKRSSTRLNNLKPQELSIQKDETWKDIVKHEKLLDKKWDDKWGFLLLPENRPKIRNEDIDRKLEEQGKNAGLLSYQKLEKRDISLNPSPPIPLKSSDYIGWRSSDRTNSFNLYPSQYRPFKIRFVDEQYGRYRILKYLQTKSPKDPEKLELPSKVIRHQVNPLLC